MSEAGSQASAEEKEENFGIGEGEEQEQGRYDAAGEIAKPGQAVAGQLQASGAGQAASQAGQSGSFSAAGHAGAVAGAAAGMAVSGARLAGQGVDAAGEALPGAIDAAGDAAGVARDAAGNVAGQAVAAAPGAAAAAREGAEAAAHAAGQAMHEAGQAGAMAADAAAAHAPAAAEAMAEGAHMAADRAADAAGAARTVGERVTQAGGAAASAAAPMAGRIASGASDAAKTGIGATTKIAGQAGEAASQALEQAPGMAVRASAGARQLVQQLDGAPKEHVLAVVRAAGTAGKQTLKWTMDGASQAAGAVNPLAGQVAGAASAAASQAGAAMGAAGAAVAGAAAQGAEAASAAGQAVAPHAQAAAAAAQQGAQQAAAAAAAAAVRAKEEAQRLGSAIASSSFVQGAAAGASDFAKTAGNQMSNVAGQINWRGAASQSYSMISTVAMAAAAAAAGVVARCNCVDILKLEIFVTAYQSIALFFTTISSQALENAKLVWGNLSTIISFEWGYTFSFNPVYVYVLVAILAIAIIVAFIWMVCQACRNVPDEFVDGHESKSWEEIKEESSYTVMGIQYILVAAMGVYLPVARVCMQIFICDGSMAIVLQEQLGGNELNCVPIEDTDPIVYECDCGAWDTYTAFQGIAVIMALYTIFLPIFIWWLITNNAPVGSDEDPNMRFDPDGAGEEGKMVPYTDKQYQQDLKEDPRYSNSPYVSLIDGIERGHMHYKVIDLVFKLLLVVPVVVLQRQPVPQGVATLVILVLYAAYNVWSAPFVSPQSDAMQIASRVNAVLTLGFGFISIEQIAPGASGAMGILINVSNAISFLVMGVLILSSVPALQSFVKNRVGAFSFTDTTLGIHGRGPRIVPNWQVMTELKHRVWQTFFDGFFASIKDEFPEGQDVCRRLRELHQRTVETGRHHITGHWEALGNPAVREGMAWVVQRLEGVDVYFQGETNFKAAPRQCYGLSRGQARKVEVNSKSFFGKLWVRAYPFECVIVYDDCSSEAFPFTALFAHDTQAFQTLLYQNQHDPNIARKKDFRRQIRALNGQQVKHHYQKTKTKRMEDGHYTDKEGKRHTRYSTVQVQFTYNDARLSVSANKSLPMAAGFNVSTTSTGHGIAHLPHTGARPCTDVDVMSTNELGIQPDMELRPGTHIGKILTSYPENRSIVQANLPKIINDAQAYRNQLNEKRMKRNEVMDEAFWFHVYDCFGVPRAALEAYFHTETNPVMRDIPDKHAEGLDFLYARVNAISRHPAAAFWFLFFEDVWANNQDMGCFQRDDEAEMQKLKELMDPAYPTAICYRPMPREELQKLLDDNGLSGSYYWFNSNLLDVLYAQMEERSKHFAQ